MEIKNFLLKLKFQDRFILVILIFIIIIIISNIVITKNLTTEDWQIIYKRLPYLLIGNQESWSIKGGFIMNIIISLSCMLISTILGIIVGLCQISQQKIIRSIAFLLTQFFRNSPWLVILFTMLYLLPFKLSFLGFSFEFSSTIKAIIGLSLVVTANIAEIVRGAIKSIPNGQWEASIAMGYNRLQILRLVIFPQAFKRMIPPWMNWYAILTMGTTLTGIVGVPEGLSAVRVILEFEGENLAIPLYGILMLLFFFYCYPIARLTRILEKKFLV